MQEVDVMTEEEQATNAQAQGESVNGFIKRAIRETMERDDQGRQRPLDVKPGDGDTLAAYDRETGEAYVAGTDGIRWSVIGNTQQQDQTGE